jgi:hypothetical protein
MTRRKLMTTAGAGLGVASTTGLAASQGRERTNRSLLEVRKISFRNTPENARAKYHTFLEKAYTPALKRAGVEVVGYFNNDIGPDKPHTLCLISYPTAASLATVQDALAADKEYTNALKEVHSQGRVYERVESSLLQAFAMVPKPENLKADRPRLFEFRVYESNDPITLAKKIGMFEEGGEIALFRKYGLEPIFFGEALIGGKIPNLTYMVAFPDANARAEAWRKFATSPEWDKLKATPGLSDGEIVSNISNATYNALPFSDIR